MTDFTLNKEPDLIVTARFIVKGADAPLTGNDYVVRLYDKDVVDNDYLGESLLDEEGRIRITFAHDAFVNEAAFHEAKPDFFFVILNKNKIIFTSKVLEDLSLKDLERFKMGEGEWVDLGTFLVDAH